MLILQYNKMLQHTVQDDKTAFLMNKDRNMVST